MTFTQSREALVRQIQRDSQGVRDPCVIDAMLAVPRERFVNPDSIEEAYADHALSIDCGQTISQPFVVGIMSEWLGAQSGQKILEIGTGSGYQTAIIVHMGAVVYSIEYHEQLHKRATEVLKNQVDDKVHLRCGDGHAGWPEEAPFDGLIITCQVDEVPPLLLEQVIEGGRIVAPVGGRSDQVLKAMIKHAHSLEVLHELPVRFVPMLGG